MKTAPAIIQWWLRVNGYRAITLPPFGIYCMPNSINDSHLARHESAHWDQYQRYGLLGFYCRYLWYMLRYGYEKHPMEIEARQKEGQPVSP